MGYNSKEIKIISSADGLKRNPFKKDKLKKFTNNPDAAINKLMLPNSNYHTARGKLFLPRKQDGGEQSVWDETKSFLNPYNWGVEDYTDKGDFKSAYSSAKKDGNEEFMYNNKRYNTKYSGTPRQEVGSYGINGKPVSKKDLNYPAQVNVYPPFGKYIPGHIEASVDRDGYSVDYSPSGNNFSGIGRVKNKEEKSFNVYGQNDSVFYDKVDNLPLGIMAEGSPSTWNLITNNCADNVCDAFGIPRSPGIETPSGTMSKIKGKYPTIDVTGRTYDDYSVFTDKLYQETPDKVLAKADHILGLAVSPDLLGTNVSKDFVRSIQNSLYELGYKLPKSISKYDNNNRFDGLLGEETKKTLLDYQTKNKKKQYGGSQEGGWLDKHEDTGEVKITNSPYQDEGSKLTAKQSNEEAYKQSIEQANKEIKQEYINQYVREGHKKIIEFAPFKAAAYLTPTGMAVGAIQGAANLAPDLYNREYLSAAGDALMMAPALGSAGKYLSKNAYNYNPWAEKLKDVNSSYRVAGMDAAKDFENTGVLRSRLPDIPKGSDLKTRAIYRPTAFPSFQKGYADLNYLPEEGGVIFKTNLPTYKRGEINPVTGLPITGRHYAHRVINPETGESLASIPAKDVKMYSSKPHWLKGYQEVPKQKYGGWLDKYDEGGNINDNEGYRASNLHNFTDKKVIDSNYIDTNNMSVPAVMANGQMLFNNTGTHYIPGKKVTEYPIKQSGGQVKWLDKYK